MVGPAAWLGVERPAHVSWCLPVRRVGDARSDWYARVGYLQDGLSAGTASLSTERERSQSWWAGCS